MRLTSSLQQSGNRLDGPCSVSYRTAVSGCHATPCTLRCPSDHTAEPGVGLSDGMDPSLFNRRIFPARLLAFCAFAPSSASPVVTYSFPSGPNLTGPPSGSLLPGIPSSP